MAIAFELGIRYLIAELLANALVLGYFFKSAGTVTVLGRKAFLNHLYDFFVFVKCYSHFCHLLKRSSYRFLYILHIICGLEAGNYITLSVNKKLCEVPVDICLVAELLIVYL